MTLERHSIDVVMRSKRSRRDGYSAYLVPHLVPSKHISVATKLKIVNLISHDWIARVLMTLKRGETGMKQKRGERCVFFYNSSVVGDLDLVNSESQLN